MYPKWKHRFELKPGYWVFVPTNDAVVYGKALITKLARQWTPPPYYYHLLNGGHVEALRGHQAHSLFVHLDIKGFYGSINLSRVTRALKRILGYLEAREAAKHSVVRNPASAEVEWMLPYGFPQSPFLASICLHSSALGAELERIHRDGQVKVSVYVDDIILSSTESGALTEALERVRAAAARAMFVLNAEKEQGPATKIVAFNVELEKGGLRLTDARIAAFQEQFAKAESEHVRRGIDSYICAVNPSQLQRVTGSEVT